MSLGGGGGGSVKPPKLKTVDPQTAAQTLLDANRIAFFGADTAYAAGAGGPGAPATGPLVPARLAAINSLVGESKGGISSQTTGALQTAGLGPEASAIPGSTEFGTALNLGGEGLSLVSKEQRDRNFAENFIAQNPPRSLGLTGDQALQILMANTGNINAYNQAIFGTQLNAFNASQAQQAQNIAGAGTLFSSFTDVLGKLFQKQDPYSDPFSNVYSNLLAGGNPDLGNLPISNLSATPPG